MAELNLRYDEINASKISKKIRCTETDIAKSNVSW